MKSLVKINLLIISIVLIMIPYKASANMALPLYPSYLTFFLIPIILIEFCAFLLLNKLMKLNLKSGKIIFLVIVANIITSLAGSIASLYVPYTQIWAGGEGVYGFSNFRNSLLGFSILFLLTVFLEWVFYLLALKKYSKIKLLIISFIVNFLSYLMLAGLIFPRLNN